MKIKKEWIIAVIGVLFVMSLMPGEGTKAADQQAIVSTEYTCFSDEDCPTCILGGIEDFDESDPSFLGELGYSECQANKCQLSEYCIVWDCGETQSDCSSVKQTILDNTVGRFKENPMLLLLTAGLIIALIML